MDGLTGIKLLRSIKDVIGLSLLKERMTEREIKAYWGIVPTGDPNLGFIIPLLKIKDMIDLGWDVTILLADVHSFMEEGSDNSTMVEYRTDYYEYIIKIIMDRLGVDGDRYRIVKGSSHQLDKRYCLDLLKFSSMINLDEALSAGSDVIKHSETPLVSRLLYPLMQVLDEKALEVDVQIGGEDQRKIFELSWKWVERLGYLKSSYLIFPFLPPLFVKKNKEPVRSLKMIDRYSYISLIDDEEKISNKIKKAFSIDRDTNYDDNPLIAIIEYVILPIEGSFTVVMEGLHKKNKVYEEIEDLKRDWEEGIVFSALLKTNITRELIRMIDPLRKAFMAYGSG